MEQIKRQRSSSSDNYEDNNRKKLQITTSEIDCLSKDSHTYFEDLSNELIYDIFEFLDYFHVYQAFFNLNIRFHNLLTNSTLPIKANLSSISKSAFQQYNKHIIVPNKHRISSLSLSNLFIYDHISSPLRILPEFVRLENLLLHNIESKYMDSLLHELISLPYLSSLTIASVDDIKNKNHIYRQIFRLPALKYCNLSMKESSDVDVLSDANTNEYSPIEYLTISNSERFNAVDSLLSYVPQLRRLSLHLANKYWMKYTEMTLSSHLLNHLVDVDLVLNDVKFDKFEQLVRNIFPVTIQLLRISIRSDSQREYLDGKRWEQLILSHMPDLRAFDIHHDSDASFNFHQLTHDAQENQFTSPFWIERQWFFEHLYYHARYGNRTTFYSTNPYRRKDYTIYKQSNETAFLTSDRTNVKSVHHVRIQSEKEMITCQNYFSNTTELTFENSFSTTRNSIAIILNPIIPLKQLTKLAIECHHFSFTRVIELLNSSPNIQTLILQSMPFYRNDCMSIQQSEHFRLVSSTNTITDVTFEDGYTLDKVQLLVALFPRLQHLTLNICAKDIGSLIQFLSETTEQNTRHMFSLCFLRATKNRLQTLEALIKSKTRFDGYMLKLVGSKLYLWW